MKTTNASSRGLYRRLLRHVRPYATWFATGIIAMIGFALTEAAIPAILKPILDGTFVEKNEFYLNWAPFGIVGLFFVRGLTGFVNATAFAAVSTRVVFDLRRQMFDRLLSLPTRYYDQQATGNLISKLTYDVTQVTDAATEALTVLVKDSVTVLGLLVFVFWLDWKLSLFVFLLFPVIAIVVVTVGRRLRRLSRGLQGSFGDLTHVLEESVRGHKVVKIFGGQEYERGRFRETANWVRRLQFKIRVASASSVPVVELLGSVIMAVVIYIGTSRATEDQLTVGGFVAFFTALGLLFSPIKRLTRVNEPLQRGLAAAESVFGLIDQPPEPDTGKGTLDIADGNLRFEDVSFAYEAEGRPALRDFTLEIPARTTTALVGASGSGKTTVANLLPRLYNLRQGRILWNGVDIRDLRLEQLRGLISLVSQDVVLFNDTIAANIAYGVSPRPAMEEIRRAAAAAHALEFIDRLPEGLETQVGENGVRLSGGQRQRLAIARALLRDAPLLILDEATSALDSESEQAVQAALESLRHRHTVLVIAHRLSTIQRADNIVVLRDGSIVEQGQHDVLLARNGHYADLYRTQFQRQPQTAV